MQIPYLSEFFATHWYLVQKDTYAIYAIYDALFSEIPYGTQLTPFRLSCFRHRSMGTSSG